MASQQSEKSPPSQRRSVCSNCNRPAPVCLCHVIPTLPISTATQIIIIQHPHESQHKLSTTPILTKSLLNATSVVSRRLKPSNLHALLTDIQPHPAATFYLFPPTPSSPAITLSELKKSINEFQITETSPVVLIVFDATWKHAKEMVKSSEGFLNKLATRVCLDGFSEQTEGGSIYDSELVLRKEPCGGCVSTLEAVARWLGAVEDNGPEIEERLIRLLKEMVRVQAQFLKPMKPRPKMLQKKKHLGENNFPHSD